MVLPWRRDLEAGLALLSFLKTELLKLTLMSDGVVAFVVNGEFVKVLNGYEAVLDLAARGLGLQAQLICRSMIESALTAWWARRHPEQVEENFDLHERYVRNLIYEMSPNDYGYGAPPRLTKGERLRAEQRFGRHGERSWTGTNVRAMATEMSLSVGLPSERHLDRLRDVHLRLDNWLMHSTAYAIRMSMEQIEGDEEVEIGYRLGPSPRGVSVALRSGWNTVLMASRAYSEEFGIDLEPELTHHVGACWSAMYDPETLSQTRRNDPCPCGSGAKFKTCHLDYRVTN
jgi:SEC-C motif